jgi:hypothetical protein
MSRTARPVTIPHGIFVEGVRHRDAMIRPLTGADEANLLESMEGLTPAQRNTALLVSALESLGPVVAPSPSLVRQLVAGDREALLLHLIRLSSGPVLNLNVECPRAQCGETLDVELDIRDVLLSEYADAAEWHQALVGNSEVRFRLPNGADQEAAAAIGESDPESAAALIAARCAAWARRRPRGRRSRRVTASVALELSDVMATMDPQAVIELRMACPACDHTFDAGFDAGEHYWNASSIRLASVFNEVHILALNYHWSEAEILAMNQQRRRRYMELLAATEPEAIAG